MTSLTPARLRRTRALTASLALALGGLVPACADDPAEPPASISTSGTGGSGGAPFGGGGGGAGGSGGEAGGSSSSIIEPVTGGGGSGGAPPSPVCSVEPPGLDAPYICPEEPLTPLDGYYLAEKWGHPVGHAIARGSIPMIANLTDDNGDGAVDLCDTPDILVHTGDPDGVWELTLLSGADGTVHPFTPPPGIGPIQPAIADLDADGVPEVIAANGKGQLLALRPDGSTIWASEDTVFPTDCEGAEQDSDTQLSCRYLQQSAVAVYDLDGDGSPEILVGLSVFEADGSLRFRDPTQATEFGATYEILSSWIRPTAVDLDGDGVLEVLFGYVTYDAFGDERWRLDTTPGFIQPGDFDADGVPELLFNNALGLWLLSGEGEVLWGPSRPPDQAEPPHPFCWAHPAALTDIDGDGVPEAFVNACEQRMVLKIASDGPEVVRSEPVQLASTFGVPSNGSTAYDFRGLGPDWLAHDHKNLTLYRATTSSVLATTNHGFLEEPAVPIVADVDNDGSADVVMVDQVRHRVRIYEDFYKRFSPARRIWNQWSYRASAVREDATIPAQSSVPADADRSHRVQTRRSCIGGS